MLPLFRGSGPAGDLQYIARQESRQQGNIVFRYNGPLVVYVRLQTSPHQLYV